VNYYQEMEQMYYQRPWYYNFWSPIENLVEDIWYYLRRSWRSAKRTYNYNYDRYTSRNETNSSSMDVSDIVPNMFYYATQSVMNLADSTIQEGQNLINKVTGRLEKAARDDTDTNSTNIHELETLWYETSRELEHILYDLTRVVSGDWGASPEVEQKQLIELKKKLKEMNNNQKSVKTHNQVEASLQQILQDVQSLTSEDKIEKLFARVNSAKLQTYKATEVVTKSVDKLSKIINTFFKTLKKVENEFLGE